MGGPLAQIRAATSEGARQDFISLTLDFFGSLDDNFTESLPQPGQDVGVSRGVAVGSGEAELHVRRVRQQRVIDATGRAFYNQTSGGFGRFLGGDASVRAERPLSRRSGLTVSGTAANEPTFLFGAFAPLAGQMNGAPVIDATPATGITQQRWMTLGGTVGVFRNATPRQRTEVQYAVARRTPTAEIGLTSVAQAASLRHGWNHHEHASLQMSYTLSDTRQSDQTGPVPPIQSHAAELSLRFERPVSAQRGFSTTFGGGATLLRAFEGRQSAAGDFVVPTGFGLARLDLSRTWSVSADARRDVTILQGLSPEPFASIAVSTRADGLIAERLQVGVSAAYAEGAAIRTDIARFSTIGGTAQAQFLFAQCCAIFTTYRYYKHDLSGIQPVTAGFPRGYSRNSAQLGVSLWFPLRDSH